MNTCIISENELEFILSIIETNKNYLIENGKDERRYFLPLPKNQGVPKLFFDIKKRILKRENILYDHIDEFNFGDYIGYITNGGKIHNHIDNSIFGYDHVRFNLFLSVPLKGGYPIYNGIKIPIKVGDYLRCNASKEYHECEIVEGNVPRITLSYGIYLKND